MKTLLSSGVLAVTLALAAPAAAQRDPRADLLKHSGLYATWSGKHPRELGGAGLIGLAAKHYAAMAPIHAWLRAL